MKKLFVIFSAFIIVCVAVSAYVDNMYKDRQYSAYSEAVSKESVYMITALNNKVVLYKDGSLYKKTDTSINTLPKKDRNEILKGIEVENEKQALRVLEDYCS